MQTFQKKERLCNRAVIDILFNEGKKFSMTPFVVLWQRPAERTDSPLKILITVSKKKFHTAVQRNHIKRLMREAFRLNKKNFTDYLQTTGQQCIFCLIYTGNGNDSLKQMESKILLILQRLQKAYEKGTD